MEKNPCSNEDPAQPKINTQFFKKEVDLKTTYNKCKGQCLTKRLLLQVMDRGSVRRGMITTESERKIKLFPPLKSNQTTL